MDRSVLFLLTCSLGVVLSCQSTGEEEETPVAVSQSVTSAWSMQECENMAQRVRAELLYSWQAYHFLAETLKYLYLLFTPEPPLDFDSVVFNTEAHPLQRHVKVAVADSP